MKGSTIPCKQASYVGEDLARRQLICRGGGGGVDTQGGGVVNGGWGDG